MSAYYVEHFSWKTPFSWMDFGLGESKMSEWSICIMDFPSFTSFLHSIICSNSVSVCLRIRWFGLVNKLQCVFVQYEIGIKSSLVNYYLVPKTSCSAYPKFRIMFARVNNRKGVKKTGQIGMIGSGLLSVGRIIWTKRFLNASRVTQYN